MAAASGRWARSAYQKLEGLRHQEAGAFPGRSILADMQARLNVQQSVAELCAGLSLDGVHGSRPRKYPDYSEQALRNTGLTLRTYGSPRVCVNMVLAVLKEGKAGKSGRALHKAPFAARPLPFAGTRVCLPELPRA
jgi:hypothetical protein